MSRGGRILRFGDRLLEGFAATEVMHPKKMKESGRWLRQVTARHRLLGLSSAQVSLREDVLALRLESYLEPGKYSPYTRATPDHYEVFWNSEIAEKAREASVEWEESPSYPGLR